MEWVTLLTWNLETGYFCDRWSHRHVPSLAVWSTKFVVQSLFANNNRLTLVMLLINVSVLEMRCTLCLFLHLYFFLLHPPLLSANLILFTLGLGHSPLPLRNDAGDWRLCQNIVNSLQKSLQSSGVMKGLQLRGQNVHWGHSHSL